MCICLSPALLFFPLASCVSGPSLPLCASLFLCPPCRRSLVFCFIHPLIILHSFAFSHKRLERSTDQVIKPINIEALSKWVGSIPQDVVKDMDKIAPMLRTLGYDPDANPPDYGKPDSFVMKKMQELERNKKQWSERESQVVRERNSIRRQFFRSKVTEESF